MDGEIVFIVLCLLLLVILAVGIGLKLYTKRRLDEIDGFKGIVKKKNLDGKVFTVGNKNGKDGGA